MQRPELFVFLLLISCHLRVQTKATSTPSTVESGKSGASEGEDAELRPKNQSCKALPFSNEGFPKLLSQTGCVNPSNPMQVNVGVLPYNITAPLWSDGSLKQRYLAIPDGQKAKISATGHIDLPVGSVTVKVFQLGGRPIETRLFMKESDTRWRGYSYEWRDDGSDADLLEGGKEKLIGDQTWVYPSSGQCDMCHNKISEVTLGLTTLQLASQLKDWEKLGVLQPFSAKLPEETLVDYTDSNQTLESRARSYLQSNCAFCHQPNGGGLGSFDLRFGPDFQAMGICNTAPLVPVFGIEDPKIYKPAIPNESILYRRMKELGDLHMPPQVARVVDEKGLELIQKWILLRRACES